MSDEGVEVGVQFFFDVGDTKHLSSLFILITSLSSARGRIFTFFLNYFWRQQEGK